MPPTVPPTQWEYFWPSTIKKICFTQLAQDMLIEEQIHRKILGYLTYGLQC